MFSPFFSTHLPFFPTDCFAAFSTDFSTDEIFEFSAEDQFDYSHVMLANGSFWRRNGLGRIHREPIPGLNKLKVFTPDDIMDGVIVKGRVVVFDDRLSPLRFRRFYNVYFI